jgi:uncharacterized damage-inducible protein DinB
LNSLQSIRELFRQMEWADSVSWKAVFSSTEAMTDSIIRERLQHIHLVQHAFLHVWRGRDFDYQQASGFSEPLSLARWGRQYHTEAAAYLAQLDEDSLNQPLVLPWAQAMVQQRFGRAAVDPILSEALMQVLLHSSYHRGQVSTRLRELGGEPPLTDFIVWVWLDKPEADWPEAVSLSRAE